jgi:hypothetical protein
MTVYLANYRKKQRIFAKREQELRHALKHGFPPKKLLRAAEKLRAAKIAVFKCYFSSRGPVQPHTFSPQAMAEHNPDLRQWLEMSAEAIVSMYRSPTT